MNTSLRRFSLCSSVLLALATGAHATEESGVSSASGYTTARTGDVHDFDYFQGAWTTQQHRLKARGVGSDDWEDFPATLCMSLYLGGLATVDELWFPSKGWAGLTLRTFDVERHQWSIYWVSSATGPWSSGQGSIHLGYPRSRSCALGAGLLVRRSHLGD